MQNCFVKVNLILQVSMRMYILNALGPVTTARQKIWRPGYGAMILKILLIIAAQKPTNLDDRAACFVHHPLTHVMLVTCT